MRAQDQIPWQNLRQRRAEMLAAMVMNCLDRFIRDDQEVDCRKYASRELMLLFSALGAEVITDFERLQAGLPQRGPMGYTDEELRIMEANRAAALFTPSSFVIKKDQK